MYNKLFDRDTYIFKRIKEHYNFIKDKYEVMGIFLQGSQNYELDIYDKDYKSDIDTKAISNAKPGLMIVKPKSSGTFK